VEATTHHSNLFSCLVGDTSKARKGTSYDHVENLLKSLDPTWKHDDQVISGCGSGEGIIYAVRDPTITSQPVKEKGRVVDYQEVITDHGVTDKRLLILEPEFVSVLKIGEREGNTLSPILRNAWDGKTLQNTVKTSPMKATNPHISVIGHITLEELQRSLTTTDMANGFANRFLWLCVKRSKYLPHGGKAHTLDWADFYKHLKKALTDAQHTREMHRSDLANIAWEAVYTPLSQGSVGLVGAITARAEAQVLRLSCLYALLDGQDTITEQHLYAALAVWQYAEESARYIFGQMVGDARAERLLTALDMAADEGLTRKQIYNDVFQNNLKAGELDILLQTLESQQHIRRELYTPPLGRPGHKYFLLPKSLRTNVLSPPSLLNIAKKAVLEAKSLYVTPNVLSTDKVETSGVSTYLVRKSEKSAEQATEPPNGVSTFIKLVRRPFCVHTLAPLGEGYVCSTCGTLFDDQDAAESGAGTDELL
jgi:hypothetical protein